MKKEIPKRRKNDTSEQTRKKLQRKKERKNES